MFEGRPESLVKCLFSMNIHIYIFENHPNIIVITRVNNRKIHIYKCTLQNMY